MIRFDIAFDSLGRLLPIIDEPRIDGIGHDQRIDAAIVLVCLQQFAHSTVPRAEGRDRQSSDLRCLRDLPLSQLLNRFIKQPSERLRLQELVAVDSRKTVERDIHDHAIAINLGNILLDHFGSPVEMHQQADLSVRRREPLRNHELTDRQRNPLAGNLWERRRCLNQHREEQCECSRDEHGRPRTVLMMRAPREEH